MALGTYSELSTAVFSRLNRSAVSADFDVAIALAEAEVNRRLAWKPVRPMHTHSTATVSAEYLGVPADILDVDSLAIDGVEVTYTSPQNLERMAAEDAAVPRYYTQIGEEFRFFPVPDTSYTLDLIYWAKVPNLNSTDTTNWLLTGHPDAYFHGVLAHLYQQYFDPEGASEQAALFDVAIEKVLSAYPTRTDTRPLKTEIGNFLLSRSTLA